MQWITSLFKDLASDTLEKRLWDAADQFRANSGLTSTQYSQPVLGLIFLRFTDARFSVRRATLEKSSARFVDEHKQNPIAELSIQDVEKTDEPDPLDTVLRTGFS